MKPKLTDRAIRYAIRQLKKGRGTRVVAEELGVTPRHIQRPWAEYARTGNVHVQHPAGQPADPEPPEQEVQAVLDVHGRKPEGVVRTAKRLRKEGCDISRHRTYGIMKSAGLVTDSPAKSRQ
jgi:transposase